MKKIIFILICLISIQINLKSQDTISAQDFTISSNIPDTAWMWFWWGNTDYRTQGQYLAPFKYAPSGIPYLYTRNADATLLLGTSTPITGYTSHKLQVDGDVRITGDINLRETSDIKFDNGAWVAAYGNDLLFNSPAVGIKTLTQLMSSGGVSAAFNGLNVNPNFGIGLGGTLRDNTQINILDKTFRISQTGSNAVRLYMDGGLGQMQIHAENDFMITSKRINLQSSNQWGLWYNQNIMGDGIDGPMFADYTPLPVGIQYAADYSANIMSQDANEALVTYRLLKQFAGDSIEQQVKISGASRPYKVAAFSSDTNTITPTTLSYSTGTLKLEPGNDTGLYINQTGNYPSIMINNRAGNQPAINVTASGTTSFGIKSSSVGLNGVPAFWGIAGASGAAGIQCDVNNFNSTTGLRIYNTSSYATSYSIYVSQSSNYPYIFYCPSKFKIDGTGTPFIRDTSLYAWVAAHGGGGSGSGIAGGGDIYKGGTRNNYNVGVYTADSILSGTTALTWHSGTSSWIMPTGIGLRMTKLAKSDTGWVAVDESGNFFSSLVTEAGFALKMSLPKTITEFLKDQKNGEISWYNSKDGVNITKSYKLSVNPTTTIQQLQAGIEISYRYIEKLENRISDIEDRLIRLENSKKKNIFNFLRN